MAYNDRGAGMVQPDAPEIKTSTIEEDIQQLNDLNQNIAEMLNKRNSLVNRIRENNKTINRQISSIQMSQYEFESSAARHLVEDEETAKSVVYETIR